jgi:hypothetical protein
MDSKALLRLDSVVGRIDAIQKNLNDVSFGISKGTALFEQIEDEFDTKTADEAHAIFVKDPVVFSIDEMKQKYNL